MSIPNHPPQGKNTLVFVENGMIHKITSHPLSESFASYYAHELERYVRAFEGEPLAIPQVHDIGVVHKGGNDYRVAHTMELSNGVNVGELRDDELLYKAVSNTIGAIAGMSTLQKDVLSVPIDMHPRNIHIEKGTPVLVDLMPPLARRNDGSFPTINIRRSNTPCRSALSEYRYGTQVGAILRLLVTARGYDTRSVIMSVSRKNYLYDMLPTDLNSRLKDSLRKNIETYCAWHIVQEVVCKGEYAAHRAGRGATFPITAPPHKVHSN